MQTKYTMAYFIMRLAAGVLLTPARRYLRSPWLWAGAGVALLIALPNLIWQAQHKLHRLGLPQCDPRPRHPVGPHGRLSAQQLYEEVNPFVLPLAIAGLIWCFLCAGREEVPRPGLDVRDDLRPAGDRPAAGRTTWLLRTPCCWQLARFGSKRLAARAGAQAVRRMAVGLVCVLVIMGAVAGVALVKPVAPINSALWNITAEMGDTLTEMVGWQDMAEQVAKIYATIPED